MTDPRHLDAGPDGRHEGERADDHGDGPQSAGGGRNRAIMNGSSRSASSEWLLDECALADLVLELGAARRQDARSVGAGIFWHER